MHAFVCRRRKIRYCWNDLLQTQAILCWHVLHIITVMYLSFSFKMQFGVNPVLSILGIPGVVCRLCCYVRTLCQSLSIETMYNSRCICSEVHPANRPFVLLVPKRNVKKKKNVLTLPTAMLSCSSPVNTCADKCPLAKQHKLISSKKFRRQLSGQNG